MKIRTIQKILTSLILSAFSLLSSCKTECKCELVDTKEHNGSVVVTAYTPDTNWSCMTSFAESIEKNHPEGLAVGFFYPREMTPRISSSMAIDQQYVPYIVANYRYSDEKGRYVLHKTENRFNLW